MNLNNETGESYLMIKSIDDERWSGTLKFLTGMVDGDKASELVKIIAGDSIRYILTLPDDAHDAELSPQDYYVGGASMLNILLAGECAEENKDIDLEDELINEIWLAYKRLSSAFVF
ncbi:hypothetical protein HZC30_03645 [Candidatus Woesearchaeota archaeon]|nr:hypothetical protein [Candidatus Woesearchaeota archaeon]